jgi:class 3 adenylate cyclase/TolB-like protein
MERRLAAILTADVVGYSRLMGEDEAGTVARLEGLTAEILGPLIEQHSGRIVKLMGDGFLVEFGSVVDSLECAVSWQKAVEARAEQTSEDRAIRFRIGVNIGDVIVKGDDVYGDGVNVAARLEGLAQPGEVLVSRTVADHVKGKIGSGFEDLGERELKNISEPVQVYRVVAQTGAPTTTTAARKKTGLPKVPLIAAGLAVLILAAGAVLWLKPWAPRIEAASVERMALPLPDKPSVAVLPFDNMSGDAEQDYFSDGMTEDLITDLSKNPELFVIARNSSFAYKGQKVKVHQVAEELGVRYVLEGSVRRAGDQVRINAQLIDATTGGMTVRSPMCSSFRTRSRGRSWPRSPSASAQRKNWRHPKPKPKAQRPTTSSCKAGTITEGEHRKTSAPPFHSSKGPFSWTPITDVQIRRWRRSIGTACGADGIGKWACPNSKLQRWRRNISEPPGKVR